MKLLKQLVLFNLEKLKLQSLILDEERWDA